MPKDSTHRIINYLMLSIFLVLNFYINIEKDYKLIAIFIGSYILGTEVFGPDLDTNSKPLHRLGIFSYIITYPIRLLSHHKGLGHNIFIGWFLKVLYLALIGIIILVITKKLGYDLYWTLSYIDNIGIISAFLVGMFLSNAIHIISDKIW